MTRLLGGGREGRLAHEALNRVIIPALRRANLQRPVDWVFVYASGAEFSASTATAITQEFGIPVVGMCLDDKQSWGGSQIGEHRAGQVDLAAPFDLWWTSSRLACDWYLCEGGRAIFMPEGFDIRKWRPGVTHQDIPVSFMGAAYGCRPSIIGYLQSHDIPIETYGAGWQNSRWVDNPVDIVRRSRINLGMGGIGYSETITNLKGRDFEIPATGGGLYITTFNADLAREFVIGKEIVCYHSRDEMLELVRYYLNHQEEAGEIALRGLQRCLAQHRWLHRYIHLATLLGILNTEGEGIASVLSHKESPCTSQF